MREKVELGIERPVTELVHLWRIVLFQFLVDGHALVFYLLTVLYKFDLFVLTFRPPLFVLFRCKFINVFSLIPTKRLSIADGTVPAIADYELFAEVPVEVIDSFEQPLVVRIISEDQ